MLSVLIAAAGDTVSKEVLLDRAWPGLTVDANNVEVQISALRKALGEDWIITVPKQGYRLAQRAVAAVHSPPPALPDKPSLVVLPFQNMSGDPEQDYFVDGLVEDITTSLCCIRSLFVIARNSAFSYKGQAVDVRQVGRELGVTLRDGRQRPPRRLTVYASLASWSKRRPESMSGAIVSTRRSMVYSNYRIGSPSAWPVPSSRPSSASKSSAHGGRRPRISLPTTITCAVLRACTRAAGKQPALLIRCLSKRPNSIRRMALPMVSPRSAPAG